MTSSLRVDVVVVYGGDDDDDDDDYNYGSDGDNANDVDDDCSDKIPTMMMMLLFFKINIIVMVTIIWRYEGDDVNDIDVDEDIASNDGPNCAFHLRVKDRQGQLTTCHL